MTEQHFPIGLWTDLLTAEDKRKMGNALWYFGWLVNRVTDQYEGPDGRPRGRVLGGSTLPARGIAPEYGESLATVRKNLSDLQKGGYIQCRQNGRGYQIEVLYAKWRDRRRSSLPNPSPPSDSHKATVPSTESSRVEEVLHPELQTSCTQSDRVHQLSPSTALKSARSEFTDPRDQSSQLSASLPSKDIATNIAVDSTETNASTRKEEAFAVVIAWEQMAPHYYAAVNRLRESGAIRPDIGALLTASWLEPAGDSWRLATGAASDLQLIKRTHLSLLQYELRQATGGPVSLTLTPESSARGP